MKRLITDAEQAELLANGSRSAVDPAFDPLSIVLIRAPDGPQTWLLTEIDPLDHDVAYGLFDLGIGQPEIGSVRLSWLATVRGPLGLALESGRTHAPNLELRLSDLARIAAAAGRILP